MMQELRYIRCRDYYIPDIRYRRKTDLLVGGDGCTEIISRSIILSSSMIYALAVRCGHIWQI